MGFGVPFAAVPWGGEVMSDGRLASDENLTSIERRLFAADLLSAFANMLLSGAMLTLLLKAVGGKEMR